MTQPKHIVVIGAGPGGYTAAFLAADLGLQVTLIDDAPEPGGVCLHRGCMPSKALLHLAKVLTEAEELKDWGVSFSEPEINLDRLRSRKNGLVSTLTGGLSQLVRQRKIDYLQGRAALLDSHTTRVTTVDGKIQDVHFDFGILATGSRPARPGNLELDHSRVLDSTRALDIRRIPESLLVVGAGYVGLELGSVYAALGSTVTVVEMTSTLLPGIDIVRSMIMGHSAGGQLALLLASKSERKPWFERGRQSSSRIRAKFFKITIHFPSVHVQCRSTCTGPPLLTIQSAVIAPSVYRPG